LRPDAGNGILSTLGRSGGGFGRHAPTDDNGLAVSPAADGARLQCLFQRLEAEATRKGLWLTSTVTNGMNDRFRILAVAVGRESVEPSLHLLRSDAPRSHLRRFPKRHRLHRQPNRPLHPPGLVEEYTVSLDGVRQDFLVLHPPEPNSHTFHSTHPSHAPLGEMQLQLIVTGAKVERAAKARSSS